MTQKNQYWYSSGPIEIVSIEKGHTSKQETISYWINMKYKNEGSKWTNSNIKIIFLILEE